MLIHIADEIIIPAYENFKVKLDSMADKSKAFTDNPNQTTLTAFRNIWVDAYTEWQKVELFDVGPASDYAVRNYFNIYPANEQGIKNNISSGSYNLEVSTSFSEQGFPALDYLINGVGSNDDEIIEQYTNATDAANRKEYVNKVVNQMKSKFNLIYSQWTGGYRDKFISRTGVDVSSSTGTLVNGYVLNYERFIRSGKFGIPSGAMIGGVVSPEKVEAFYKKDISLTLAKTAHQASIDFFNGKSVKTGEEGPSFKTYLNALDAKDSKTGNSLSDIINAQFASVNEALNLLPPNLYEEVKTNNQAMVNVYNEMQKAVRMLKVDMTSAMSITITYTDNDGD